MAEGECGIVDNSRTLVGIVERGADTFEEAAPSAGHS